MNSKFRRIKEISRLINSVDVVFSARIWPDGIYLSLSLSDICSTHRSSTIAHRLAARFMGWLSVILLELNIMSLHQRDRMFCTEWSVHGPFTYLSVYRSTEASAVDSPYMPTRLTQAANIAGGRCN